MKFQGIYQSYSEEPEICSPWLGFCFYMKQEGGVMPHTIITLCMTPAASKFQLRLQSVMFSANNLPSSPSHLAAISKVATSCSPFSQQQSGVTLPNRRSYSRITAVPPRAESGLQQLNGWVRASIAALTAHPPTMQWKHEHLMMSGSRLPSIRACPSPPSSGSAWTADIHAG